MNTTQLNNSLLNTLIAQPAYTGIFDREYLSIACAAAIRFGASNEAACALAAELVIAQHTTRLERMRYAPLTPGYKRAWDEDLNRQAYQKRIAQLEDALNVIRKTSAHATHTELPVAA